MCSEYETPNEEYMKNLKCDCCGEPIIDLRFPVAVINPYETLCLPCFRAENRHNAEVIKQNANNYVLKRNLELENNKVRTLRGHLNNANYKLSENIKKEEQIDELIDECYNLALKSDSAAAIEIIKELKKEYKNIGEN